MAAIPSNVLPHPFILRAPAERTSGPVPGEGMMVDLGDPMMVEEDGVRFTQLGGGGVEVDFDPQVGALVEDDRQDATEHGANLADFVTSGERQRIATDLIEGIESDIASRSEWYQRLGEGLTLLGIAKPRHDLGVLKSAEQISHPIIAEAVVQFQARAIAELFQPGGPAKTVVIGQTSREREEQATRVKDYMNYQLAYEDKPYFEETDQMLFMLSLEGSEFRKVYRDPLVKKNVARWVKPEDFIVPYSTTSLETAPRYTHVLHEYHNDLLKKQASRFYRDAVIAQPTSVATASAQHPLVEAKTAADGVEVSAARPEDITHTVYEVHCELDLEGFEDEDSLGQPTGIALPYVVFIEAESQEVLAIYRNWREQDPLRRKRIWFTHYKYLPGTGFYGFGLLHLLGGLGAAATGVLRLIMVAGAFAGAGGGFKAKGTKIAGSVELKPGVYTDTEHTFEELSKAFYSPQFKEPSVALFNVLGHLVDQGHRFASTTETTVGDAKNTGPVGTTIALIEQGQKVFSGIHKRCHMALGRELEMLAELNGEHLPTKDEGGYPFAVPGAMKTIMREDFDDAVDVIPVSDPNISSNQQRIAIAQTTVEMANDAPDIWDRREAHRRLAEALRVPDVEDIIKDRSKIERADPVSENAMAIVNRPVRVYEDQDHDAHIAVHNAIIQDQQMPAQAKSVIASHIAEHLAHKFRIQAAHAMGMPPVPMDFDAEPGEPVAQPLDPQMERLLSQRAAMAVNKLQPPQKDPKVVQAEGKVQLEEMVAKAKIKRETMEANHRMALERKVAFAKIALEREVAIRRMEQEGQVEQANQERENLKMEGEKVEADVQKAVADLEQAVTEIARWIASRNQAEGGGNEPAV